MPRRTFLRGVGASLALPWLEAMAPRARAATTAARPPQRFAFLYTPNGYNQQTFVPKTTGTGWELTPALEPLAALRNEITVCSGLDRKFVGGTGVHAQCGACWLTSSPPSETLDGGFPTNTTLDQIIAREIVGRAGGLVCISSINDPTAGFIENLVGYGTQLVERYDRQYELRAGEVVIVISNSGKT